MPHDASRRTFLMNASVALGQGALRISFPAAMAAAQLACQRQQAGQAFKTLTDIEAQGFGAVLEQIIPTDETPGARDAGVVWFVDEALSGFMKGAAGMLRAGLANLNSAAKGADGKSGFADLSFDQQTELLKAQENTPFFGTMRTLCQFGMFAMPSYGGNRDELGWQLLGFDHRHAWQPPFGFYDAQVLAQADALATKQARFAEPEVPDHD